MPAEDRFKVVDQPVLAPGACVVSNASGGKKGPYVDLGRNIRGYGQLYICADMVKAMYDSVIAHENQFVEPVVVETSDEHEARLLELKNSVVKDLDNALGSLARLFADYSIADSFPIPPSPDEDSGEADGAPEPDSPAPKRGGRDGVSGDSTDESDDDDLGGVLKI